VKLTLKACIQSRHVVCHLGVTLCIDKTVFKLKGVFYGPSFRY